MTKKLSQFEKKTFVVSSTLEMKSGELMGSGKGKIKEEEEMLAEEDYKCKTKALEISGKLDLPERYFGVDTNILIPNDDLCYLYYRPKYGAFNLFFSGYRELDSSFTFDVENIRDRCKDWTNLLLTSHNSKLSGTIYFLTGYLYQTFDQRRNGEYIKEFRSKGFGLEDPISFQIFISPQGDLDLQENSS